MRNINPNGMKRNAQKDITRCICDFNPGIGGFICCDKCSVWQHMRCMGVLPNKIPKIYECELCNPRPVNKQGAVQLQLLLRDEESSDSEEDRVQVQKTNHRKTNVKRSRKASSNSVKSEDAYDFRDDGKSYKDVKENMYSPAILHRLEPRTEGQASFGTSPPGVARVQPQAGYTPINTTHGTPAMLQVVNHGPSKIVITRQTVRPGHFISDYMGHFKRLSELFEEISGKSTLYKRPLNYVLHYPILDLCVDTREYGTISRFVRRSCHPNAQVKSYLMEGKLHMGIYAKELITPNSEITLSFDLYIEDYQFVQTCACSSVGCLVAKNNDRITSSAAKARQFRRTDSMDSINSDEEHRKHKLTREEVKIQSYIQTIEKIEREEQRKRILSENTKSPAREHAEVEEDANTTPSRGGKSRRRKGSGKKLRKGSGCSATLPVSHNISIKSPEHFTFDPGVNSTTTSITNSTVNSPEHSPCFYYPRTAPSPVYTVREPELSKHYLKYNGHEHDIHLRPMNTTPYSKPRRNLTLKNTNTLTPIKIQVDGFIVPLHGSLLTPRVKPTLPSYKTSKKRWLEHFMQEGVTSDNPSSPPRTPVPVLVNETEINVRIQDDESLSAAARSLQLTEEASPIVEMKDETKIEPPPHPALDITPPFPETIVTAASLADLPISSISLNLPDSNSSTFSTPINTPTTNTPTTNTPTTNTPTTNTPTTNTPAVVAEKKKVSLADYRKRLQSRSSRPSNKESISSDGTFESKSDKENSPRNLPVFEPISPEDSEKASNSRSTLLAEFIRPSLSESISHESLHPSKIRRVEVSEFSVEPSPRNESADAPLLHTKRLPSYESPLTTPPTVPTLPIESIQHRVYDSTGKSPYTLSNGISGNHISKSPENSPSRALSDDAFYKIKEILSQSKTGFVSTNTGNLNVSSSIVKTTHAMYDPNATSIKNYPYPNQFNDDVYSRDNKRLKPSLGNSSEYKYFNDTDQR